MSLSNTQTRYGNVTKTFHWLTALLIVVLIPSGIVANGLPYDTVEEVTRKAQLFSIHKTLGVTLFTVAVLRILWALTQPKPAPLHPDRKGEHFLAETVHWLLYGSLVIVPLSGWVHHAATEGFAPILWPFGQNLPFVPKSEALAHASASLHIIFERVLVIALFLHIAGALKHHFVDRDATLKRMWFGATEAGEGGDRTSRFAPMIAALTAWALAIGVGTSIGMFERHEATDSNTALTEVESEWQVESGTLGITVDQLGSKVSGAFSDWTAAITFDENAAGVMGDVDVTISIASLTLGSVTQEALKPEYFDVGMFPTARFVAEITRSNTGYVATGTLTIKNNSIPLALPFDLTIEGERATMSGNVTVDRRDFGVGGESESSVRHPVDISVVLTAMR